MKLMVLLTNVIFFYIVWWNVNIWKICMTQWTNIFQMFMQDVTKSCKGKRSIQILRTKDDPGWHVENGNGKEEWKLVVSNLSFSLGLLFFLYTYYSQKDVFSIFLKNYEDIANLREGHFQENTTRLSMIIFNTETFTLIYSEFNYYILIIKINWSHLHPSFAFLFTDLLYCHLLSPWLSSLIIFFLSILTVHQLI